MVSVSGINTVFTVSSTGNTLEPRIVSSLQLFKANKEIPAIIKAGMQEKRRDFKGILFDECDKLNS
jgi:hypothetical protein